MLCEKNYVKISECDQHPLLDGQILFNIQNIFIYVWWLTVYDNTKLLLFHFSISSINYSTQSTTKSEKNNCYQLVIKQETEENFTKILTEKPATCCQEGPTIPAASTTHTPL